jgi:hypothetical protein
MQPPNKDASTIPQDTVATAKGNLQQAIDSTKKVPVQPEKPVKQDGFQETLKLWNQRILGKKAEEAKAAQPGTTTPVKAVPTAGMPPQQAGVQQPPNVAVPVQGTPPPQTGGPPDLTKGKGPAPAKTKEQIAAEARKRKVDNLRQSLAQVRTTAGSLSAGRSQVVLPMLEAVENGITLLAQQQDDTVFNQQFKALQADLTKAKDAAAQPEGVDDPAAEYQAVAEFFDLFTANAVSALQRPDLKDRAARLAACINEAKTLAQDPNTLAQARDKANEANGLNTELDVALRYADVKTKSEAEAEEPYTEKLAKAKDQVKTGVSQLASGNIKDFRDVWAGLKPGKTDLVLEDLKGLWKDMAKEIVKKPELFKAIAADPVLCADFLITAGPGLPKDALTAEDLKGMGKDGPAVAARVLLKNCVEPDDKQNPALQKWMWESVTENEWKDRSLGLSAQVFNAVWNDKDNPKRFDKIGEIIASGADTMQAHNLGQDTGRGDREGIWSGYIQPMEHLIGNYVKKVHLLDVNGNDPVKAGLKPDDVPKIEGAKKVLGALKKSDKTTILTDYTAVKESPALAAFTKEPGTIWGFEDVRLPYVQAARETKHGQQPLRMWEMWKAIEEALNEKGYDELYQNPDKAIPEFIKAGLEKIEKKKQEGKEEEYKDYDATFLKNFEKDATNYLKFLSTQSPKGEFDTAELGGLNAGKLMGGLGCKAGLWWAKENKKPVYYCLDGIRIEDALNYKVMRNNAIKANLDKGGKQHFEVITLVEIREILKNWEDLKGTVKFVEKGNLKTDLKDVDEWCAKMKESNEKAGKRPARKVRFKDKLDALGKDLHQKVDDRDALLVVRAADRLKRSAKAANKDLLVACLNDNCEKLYEYNILPRQLAVHFRVMLIGNEAARTQAVSSLTTLLNPVCAELKAPLLERLK